MPRAIPTPIRAAFALALVFSAASASAQVVLRDRVEVSPAPEAVQGPLARSVAAGAYPTDDGIYYSVQVRPSRGFATCCQGHQGAHTTCHSPFAHDDALVFRGVGYDGTPFESTLRVLDALAPTTSYVSEAYYPLGYDLWPYRN